MMQPGVDDITRRIRILRQERRWTTTELSLLTDIAGYRIPRSILTNMENGRRDMITVTELLTLAKVFGAHLHWLATGEGPACATCQDQAPEGFICKECGKEGTWNPTPVVS